MDNEELMTEIRHLRERLKQVNRKNKDLKQQLSAKQEVIEGPVKKLKQDSEDQRLIQKLLHSYTGAYVNIKEDSIEVCLKTYYDGVPQRDYVIILENLRKRSWKLVGYDLPISVVRKQGLSLGSEDELCQFVQNVSREVQAFAERKYQVAKTEEILKEVNGSFIWYSTKYQKILLKLPLDSGSSQTKYLAEIVLDYEFDQVLPHEVTTNAEGLHKEKLEMLRKRFKTLFMDYSLLAVMREEFLSQSLSEKGDLSNSQSNGHPSLLLSCLSSSDDSS